jgi:hypothetical protein
MLSSASLIKKKYLSLFDYILLHKDIHGLGTIHDWLTSTPSWGKFDFQLSDIIRGGEERDMKHDKDRNRRM